MVRFVLISLKMKISEPGTAYELKIDPETEYDAKFTMSPKKLAWVFDQLPKEETHNVNISVKMIKGERKISFITDNDMFRISYPLFSTDRADIKMEKKIMEDGIQKAVCVKCLQDIIKKSTVDPFDIDATDVAMYMGTDASTVSVIVYTYPATETKEYRLQEADHIYHNATFHRNEVDAGPSKVFKSQKRERDEVNAEAKRPKLNPKDGDDIAEGDIVPEDEDGLEEGGIFPDDGDDAETEVGEKAEK